MRVLFCFCVLAGLISGCGPSEVNPRMIGATSVSPTPTPSTTPSPSPTPSLRYLNIDFGSGTSSSKAGMAAVGSNSLDFWNLCAIIGVSPTSCNVSNAKLTDQTSSQITVGLQTASPASLQSFTNGLTDPMYASYLTSSLGSPMTISVSGLATGLYDFYVYGHGPFTNANSRYDLSVNGTAMGSKATINGTAWNLPDWTEGNQYVAFNAIQISAGQPVQILVSSTGYRALVSGMQIILH